MRYLSNGISNRNNFTKIAIPFNGIGDSPYEFFMDNYTFWCPDTTLIEVYLENEEEIFNEILVDTICWGESLTFKFRIKNVGRERLFLKDDKMPIHSSNDAYRIESTPKFYIQPEDSTTFEIVFTQDSPGTYETDILIPYHAQDSNGYYFKLRTVILPYDTPSEQVFCDNISEGEANRILALIKDSSLVLGTVFCIPIYLQNMEEVYRFMAELSWDKTFLSYSSFNNLSIPITHQNDLIFNLKEDSLLYIQWFDRDYSGEFFPESLPSFEVCFQAIQVGSTVLRLDKLDIRLVRD